MGTRAARGGLAAGRYPWGDELAPGGERRANLWQGGFPARSVAGWLPGTVPVDSFAPNGWGLHNIAGNAWEWCADWFSAGYHAQTQRPDLLQQGATGRRSTRGGSFLCHGSCCNRYRVTARGSDTPGSSASDWGFRVAATLGRTGSELQ